MEVQAGALIGKTYMTEYSIRSYAHLGDAVYEVWAREKTINLTSRPEKLHKMTIAIVNAEFHAQILEKIEEYLDATEKDIVRRARNMPVTTARRVNQKLHRLSTAFEALIGYLYLNNRERLNAVYLLIEPFVEEKLSQMV